MYINIFKTLKKWNCPWLLKWRTQNFWVCGGKKEFTMVSTVKKKTEKKYCFVLFLSSMRSLEWESFAESKIGNVDWKVIKSKWLFSGNFIRETFLSQGKKHVQFKNIKRKAKPHNPYKVPKCAVFFTVQSQHRTGVQPQVL